MEKVILVIDKPNNCNSCRLYVDKSLEDGWCIYSSFKVPICKQYCPLKPLPKKKNPLDDGGMFLGKGIEGYNACIDEILGEE